MQTEDSILNDFIDVVNRRLGNHLKKIILFGSRARGEGDVDSDYDCLLVLDSVSHDVIDKVDDVTADFLYHHNVIFSAFPVSEEHYQNRKFNPLFMNIRRDGIAL
jgi:predicted nucleotidyltransferase